MATVTYALEGKIRVVEVCRPWNGPDSAQRKITDEEAERMADYCINHCPYADRDDCCDCLSGKNVDSNAAIGRPEKDIDMELLELLVCQKKKSQEIAKILRCSERTVSRRRKLLKQRKANVQLKLELVETKCGA